MREIKFRAWDTLLSRIIGIKTMDKFTIRNDGLVSTSSDNDIRLMQYTGLKDKNGVEIYECDVVWFDFNPEKYEKCTIIYEQSECQFQAKPIKYKNCAGFRVGTRLKDDVCGHVEVIGNIYENPKLLEDK